ncbi:MAG: UDP-glucose/GDP-mannose dehydrogenase family protein [Dehalococcoidia bacterium]
MRITVVGGAGYVGLVTGIGLAALGHDVTNVDVDRKRVEMLSDGHSPIYEEGIEEQLRANLEAGRLKFSADIDKVIPGSEMVFIAVGTPSRQDGQADLSQVIGVAEDLARLIDCYTVIVIKSTVPVGTVDLVRSVLSGEKVEGKDFDLVSNPEFLREGKAVYDFFNPDRIVIGAEADRPRAKMHELYKPLIFREVSWPESNGATERSPVPVVETGIASAQTIKYASNAFLATRISFINEIAGLCERVGADVTEVARGMGFDPRIGPAYLAAGLGFGGPCLEKDLKALIKIAEGVDYEAELLKSVLDRNERQLVDIVSKVTTRAGSTGMLYRKKIAVLGLSFKAGTNDVRNSLAPKVVERLEKSGALVRAHDPVAIPDARLMWPDVTYCDDPYETTRRADALLVLTEWPQYRELDFARVRDLMAVPNVIDARNHLDRSMLTGLGFSYTGVGRA